VAFSPARVIAMSPGISLRMPNTMKVASTSTGTAWSRRRRMTREREELNIDIAGRSPFSARQRDELVLRLADEVGLVADDLLRDGGHFRIEGDRHDQRLLHHDALEPREYLLALRHVLALAAPGQQFSQLRGCLHPAGIE